MLRNQWLEALGPGASAQWAPPRQGAGGTPRFAAAVVAHLVDAVALGATRGELHLDPGFIGHLVLCETHFAKVASGQAAIDARLGQQPRRASRIRNDCGAP